MRWDNDACILEMLYDTVMNSHSKNCHNPLQTLLHFDQYSYQECQPQSQRRDFFDQLGVAIDQAQENGGLRVWLRRTLLPILDGLRIGT